MHENYKTYVSSRLLSNSTAHANGCIEYGKRAPLKHKYGVTSITIDGVRKNVTVHRAMWMAVNNKFDLPGNIVVRHKCDNPRCINIEHLDIGTALDNVRDCITRGRRAKTHKPHCRVRTHPDSVVIAIRNDTGKLKQIAYRHGVSVSYVSRVRRGELKALVT